MTDQLTLGWDAPEAVAHVRDVLGLDRGRPARAAAPKATAQPAGAPEPVVVLDARGQVLPPHMRPGWRRSIPPANKGRKYPPTPPTAAEAWQLLQACAVDHRDPNHRMSALRNRALIATLWRTGVRISEALALEEHDLDLEQGTIRVRQGKGDKPRTVPADRWLVPELTTWLDHRHHLPPGELFCVIKGPTAGRAMSAPDARRVHRDLCRRAGVRKRVAPHQWRHRFAIDLLEEGRTMVEISRMLGHADLGVTSVYFAGIDGESIATRIAYERKVPTMPVPHRAS